MILKISKLFSIFVIFLLICPSSQARLINGGFSKKDSSEEFKLQEGATLAKLLNPKVFKPQEPTYKIFQKEVTLANLDKKIPEKSLAFSSSLTSSNGLSISPLVLSKNFERNKENVKDLTYSFNSLPLTVYMDTVYIDKLQNPSQKISLIVKGEENPKKPSLLLKRMARVGKKVLSFFSESMSSTRKVKGDDGKEYTLVMGSVPISSVGKVIKFPWQRNGVKVAVKFPKKVLKKIDKLPHQDKARLLSPDKAFVKSTSEAKFPFELRPNGNGCKWRVGLEKVNGCFEAVKVFSKK